MAYIGKVPSAVPITSADLADSIVTSAKIADGTITLSDLSATGTQDANTFLRGDNTFAVAGGIFESQLLHIRDEKSSGTAGGGATSGSFATRTLNTVMTNEISGASLASNQITLPAGTYYINAKAPSRNVDGHKIKLRNTTDSSDTLIGTNAQAQAAGYILTQSFISGRFTIASEKVFEIQHRVEATQATYGFGNAITFGVVEVYTDVQIWKVA